MSKVYAFVYGTLKHNQKAHSKLSTPSCPAKFICEDFIPDFSVHSYCGAFPMAKKNPGCQVLGEIYEVDPAVIPILDSYEGYPTLYQKEEVLSKQGYTCTIYFASAINAADCTVENQCPNDAWYR